MDCMDTLIEKHKTALHALRSSGGTNIKTAERTFDAVRHAENRREYERCNADFHDVGGLMGDDHFSL